MKPLFIDFDGVIRFGKNLAPDAGDFLRYIEQENIPALILSNSSLLTGADIHKKLSEAGIPTSIPVLTTVDAAYAMIKESGKRVTVHCNESIKPIFQEFVDDAHPELIVIGDIGNKWTYEILNTIFLQVRNGAKILALHKNKYWSPDGGEVCLDAGTFIAAIEYATGINSILLGKPAPLYFTNALHALGFANATEFIMLGDDLDTDIAGAKNLGGTGILILTGKTKLPLPENILHQPDYVVHNLMEAVEVLKQM